MKKTSCIICRKRKGQRVCLINNGLLICSLCCATSRNDRCGDCSHFVQAKKYSDEKNREKSNRPFVARLDPEVDDLVDKALELVDNGDIKTGAIILDELVRKHPDLFIVHYGQGVVLANQEKYKEAIASFDKCVEIFPYLTEAWFNKAMSHQHLFDFGGTMKSFQMVVKYGEGSHEEHVVTAGRMLETCSATILKDAGLSLDSYLHYMDIFDQGFSCMNEKKYEQAIALFAEVVNGYTDHCQSHGNIGLCYMFLRKNTEALAALERALEIDPDYAPAIQNRKILLSLPAGKPLPEGETVCIDYHRDRMNSYKTATLKDRIRNLFKLRW